MTKLKNSNCEKKKLNSSNSDKTQKLQLGQNLTVVIVNNFNTLTTDETFEGQRFAILAMFYSSLHLHFLLENLGVNQNHKGGENGRHSNNSTLLPQPK